MALIKCPECGKEISDKAPVCIHCGFPLDQLETVVENDDGKLYKLILKSTPIDTKVKTIKLVMDIQGCGLKEGKDIVDNPPQIIATSLSQSDAQKLAKEFTALQNSMDIQVDEEAVSSIDIFSKIQSNENGRKEKLERAEAIENSKPKCPTCGSTNIKKISGTKRWVTTGLFGLASSNVGKTMECKNCGYKW